MKQFAFLLLATLTVATLHAQESATVGQVLNGMLSIAEEKCTSKSGGMPGKGAQDAFKTVCVCMPSETKQLLASLSPEELAKAVNEAQFKEMFKHSVIDRCAAKQLRTTYGGECEERFSSLVKDAKSYCGCMKERLAKTPDSELADIGIMSSDYLPLAAQSKRQGLPSPEAPPLLKKYFSDEKNCRASPK